MTSNLAFGYRTDPTQTQIDRDSNDPDNPKHFAVVFAVVSEYNSEDDTTEISCSTGTAGDHTCEQISIVLGKDKCESYSTIGLRMNVRHE